MKTNASKKKKKMEGALSLNKKVNKGVILKSYRSLEAR